MNKPDKRKEVFVQIQRLNKETNVKKYQYQRQRMNKPTNRQTEREQLEQSSSSLQPNSGCVHLVRFYFQLKLKLKHFNTLFTKMQNIQFVSKNIHSIFNYTFNRQLKSSNFYCNNVCKKRLLDVGMLFAFVRALRCDEVIEVDHMDWIFLVGSLHLFLRSFTKRWRLSISLLLCLSLFLSVYLFVRSRFWNIFGFQNVAS
jgi:hypothetical protein